MKKFLVMLLVTIMAVMSATVVVSANELEDDVINEQRFTLNERVEVPDVCIFSITSIELAAAEEEGFQQLSFSLLFQNMSLRAVDISELLEYELVFQERFTFELTNPEDLEHSIRPLVERTVTLVFELPNAALRGLHDELILSLSFGDSESYELDVLVALGLAVDVDDMDVPIVVLGRNMPLLTPSRWMNLGSFAIRLDEVIELEMIPFLPEDIEVDESERFLVTVLTIRNLSPDELSIEESISAEVIFRDRFIFESIGSLVSRETLTPLEEGMIYIALLAPNIVFTSDDEELWINFEIGDKELTVEVRDIIIQRQEGIAFTSFEPVPEYTGEQDVESSEDEVAQGVETTDTRYFFESFLGTTRLSGDWVRTNGDTWRFDGENGYHLTGSDGFLSLGNYELEQLALHYRMSSANVTAEFEARGSGNTIAFVYLGGNEERVAVDGFQFWRRSNNIYYYPTIANDRNWVAIGRIPTIPVEEYVSIRFHIFDGQVDIYFNNEYIQSRELTGDFPAFGIRRSGHDWHIRNLRITFH